MDLFLILKAFLSQQKSNTKATIKVEHTTISILFSIKTKTCPTIVLFYIISDKNAILSDSVPNIMIRRFIC